MAVWGTWKEAFCMRGCTKMVYWDNNRSPKSVFICTCCFVHNGTFIWLKEYRTNYFTRMICPCTVSPVNWTQVGFPLPSVMHVSISPLSSRDKWGKKNSKISPASLFTVANAKTLLFGSNFLIYVDILCLCAALQECWCFSLSAFLVCKVWGLNEELTGLIKWERRRVSNWLQFIHKHANT